MQIAKVECLLRLSQNGNINLLSVPKFGPDAILVTEIPLLRMINDIEEGGGDEDCCVSEVTVIDMVETTRAAEIERLKAKYGTKLMAAVYPGGRGLPTNLEQCEIPSSAMAKHKPKPKAAKPDPKAADTTATADAAAA